MTSKIWKVTGRKKGQAWELTRFFVGDFVLRLLSYVQDFTSRGREAWVIVYVIEPWITSISKGTT